MRLLASPLNILTLVVLVTLAACGNAGDSPARVADHHEAERAPGDGEPETLGASRAALTATDPVSAAVAQSCATNAVAALSTQLVEEIQCLRPGTLKRIDGIAGLSLGSSVFPYLQTPAAEAVIAAQKARGATMSVNSALRSLAQQYLLYRWYKTGRCGIGLAASPGKSNHESALAVDIGDNASWRTTMATKEMRWLGSSDPVHFDYVGAGRVELRGLSVLAFQRLWNRNHPEDKIAEDSDYGASTEERLAKSPVGGFAKGADCTQTKPAVDAGPPGEVPAVPDGPEVGPARDDADAESDSGCTAAGAMPRPDRALDGALPLLSVAAVAAVAARRRRVARVARVAHRSGATTRS